MYNVTTTIDVFSSNSLTIKHNFSSSIEICYIEQLVLDFINLSLKVEYNFFTLSYQTEIQLIEFSSLSWKCNLSSEIFVNSLMYTGVWNFWVLLKLGLFCFVFVLPHSLLFVSSSLNFALPQEEASLAGTTLPCGSSPSAPPPILLGMIWFLLFSDMLLQWFFFNF